LNTKIGISYFLENNFTQNTSFSGFNPHNTFIAQQASIRSPWLPKVSLADSTTFSTPYSRNLQQDGFIYEDGSLHNLSFGIGLDMSDIFSIGGCFSMKFGTYNYSRRYFETDRDNIYNQYLIDDLYQLNVSEKLSQEVFGVSGVIGVQAKIDQLCRFGLSVSFPTMISTTEYFGVDYVVLFDPEFPG